MDPETYSSLPASVLAWKRANKLGRFDPSAPEQVASKVSSHWDTISSRGIEVGKRCRVGSDDAARRGVIRYVGEIKEIPGPEGAPWVGVELDEPVGKNNGSIKGVKYFEVEGGSLKGVFVRGERVEVGDFGVLEEGLEDEDMEEI